MRRRMLHLALLVWALALTTASAQDEVVLSGQITDPHVSPVSLGAVTAVDLSVDTAVEDEAQSLLLPPHLGRFFIIHKA